MTEKQRVSQISGGDDDDNRAPAEGLMVSSAFTDMTYMSEMTRPFYCAPAAGIITHSAAV